MKIIAYWGTEVVLDQTKKGLKCRDILGSQGGRQIVQCSQVVSLAICQDISAQSIKGERRSLPPPETA